MSSRRGFSFVEMVMALGLLGLLLPLLCNLLPGGLLAQKQADDLESASAFAAGLVRAGAHSPPSAAGMDYNQTVTLGRQTYRATREFFSVNAQLMDVVVRLDNGHSPPIVMTTRVFLRL